jgi:hypothetical protein
MPEMVANPVAWGSFVDIPDTYFFIQKFHEMSEDIPDFTDFPALIAEMHQRGVSPDGNSASLTSRMGVIIRNTFHPAIPGRSASPRVCSISLTVSSRPRVMTTILNTSRRRQWRRLFLGCFVHLRLKEGRLFLGLFTAICGRGTLP